LVNSDLEKLLNKKRAFRVGDQELLRTTEKVEKEAKRK